MKQSRALALTLAAALHLFALTTASAQSLGTAGTITGTVTDPTGASVPKAAVELRNGIANFVQATTTDDDGAFRFNNVPKNTYELSVNAPGFSVARQSVEVRTAVPISVQIQLTIAAGEQSVDVQATGSQVETDPSTHQDVSSDQLAKLPVFDPASGLSSAITNTSGAVVADANGFFHPLGDHAQTTFVIDGQPVSDQQSKAFSTQLPANVVQGMELITGAADAEYGDKSGLVVNATTRSGLGAAKPFGSIEAFAGSYGTWGENATFGFGGPKWGTFLAINGIRTSRFLDSPEFNPIHDVGNNETIFDRLDYQPTANDALHLNLFVARNWFQAPNNYDQLPQDQKQRVLTWNIAPGFQHTLNPSTLLTVNAYGRRDQENYYGSRDPFHDTPATVSQGRFLTNYGLRADVATVQGRHNLKLGLQIQQTRLSEGFSFGLTDPLFNAVCLDGLGNPLSLPQVTTPEGCAAVNATYQPNPNLNLGLIPYDLTRGGSPLVFRDRHNINQYAFYITDLINLGHFTINTGIRIDSYRGLVSANGVQPRLAVSYLWAKTGTVFRAAYSRSFETPYNENLLLSSATGVGGLSAGGISNNQAQLIRPGLRNQFNTGLQQKLGRYLIADADYFWKYTHNAFDFAVLFNTPITFPISWRKSKLDGFTGRVSTVDIHGFQAYFTMGHTRARFFPPEVGGLVLQGTPPNGVFRIDHDQAFQQTTNLRYQYHKNGPWISFIWRYDSGEVNGSVPDIASALALTAAQQAAIGFYCGSVFATREQPIVSCPSGGGALRVLIPKPGTENPDTNPPRIAPRNLFDLALGTDNLLRSASEQRVTVRVSVDNFTNAQALYNFLSTFSGTHFLAPRSYQVSLGYLF